MNEEKYTDVKIFGCRINNTIGVILFYLVFSWVIGYIGLIHTFIIFFTQLIGLTGSGLTFALTISLINFFFYVVFLIVYMYILVRCSKLKNTYEEDGENERRWFGFRLNQTSSTFLRILSILNILLSIFSLYGLISAYIELSIVFSFSVPTTLTVQSILNMIDSLLLLLLNIYTFIMCKRRFSK